MIVYRTDWTDVVLNRLTSIVKNGHEYRVFLNGRVVVAAMRDAGESGPMLVLDGAAEYVCLFDHKPFDFDIFHRDTDL